MNRGEWWDRLMAHVLISQNVTLYRMHSSHNFDWRPFLAPLRIALKNFCQGKHPPPAVIVALKQIIFCNSMLHARFRERPWEP